MFGFLWGFVNKNDKSNIPKWREENKDMNDKRRLFLKGCILLIVLIVAIGLLLTVHNIRKNTLPKAEMIVENAQDVIIQLANEESEYGYINALSELTEKSTSIVDGDNYYRLQQNYHGIPVYGRTVVCVADENGTVTSITGNITDIDLNIDLTSLITKEQVTESLNNYFENNMSSGVTNIEIDDLDDECLCIYVTDTYQTYLAYNIDIGIYEVIINAESADILSVSKTIRNVTEAEIGYTEFDLNQTDGFPVKKYSDECYVLEDSSKKLKVYTMAGELSQENNMFHLERAIQIESPDNIFGNTETEVLLEYEKGVQLLDNVSECYDYFDELGFISEGLGTCLYYNDGYDQGENAIGGYGDIFDTGYDYGILSVGTITGVNDIDVIGHEYTHRVSRQLIGWSDNSLENRALNEAFSDIFGELIESKMNESITEPDWIMQCDNVSSIHRNLTNPDESGYADNTSFKYEGVDVEYRYSTVISHAAYLMWNGGINGDDSKKISADDLAKLWYRAMLMMPSDCDFYDCRKLVELAGTSMELTVNQIECISEVFDTVGITDATQKTISNTYNLALNSTLSVFGGNGELYDNYKLQITGKGPQIEKVDTSYERIKTITKAEPCELDLPKGIYEFRISDNTNPENTFTYHITVMDTDGESNLELFTNFGSTSVKGSISEIGVKEGVETNIPISNAVVTIFSNSENIVYETINMENKDGIFETYLPIGVYSVVVEAEGYRSSTTSFEVTYEQDVYLSITLIKNIIADEQFWHDFIKDKNYNQYIEAWTFPVYGYHILDINQDGIKELILASEDDGSGFWEYQIYAVVDNDIVVIDEGWVCYAISYSEEYKSIVYSDTKPSPMSSGVDYVSFDGHRMNHEFHIFKEWVADEMELRYAKSTVEKTVELSEDEYNLYINAPIEILDWIIITERNVDYDENAPNVAVSDHSTETAVNDKVIECYKRILKQYPESTSFSYTLNGEIVEVKIPTEYITYDIDKNGIAELIIKEDSTQYHIYTIDGESIVQCGDFYWPYSDCLYACDENGLIVHDGGSGNIHIEYVSLYSLNSGTLAVSRDLVNTEVDSMDDVITCLENYTCINNFCSITDDSLLVIE